MRAIVVLLLASACTKGLPHAKTCEISPPEAGALHPDGRMLLDESDRQVILRGVNAGGRAKFAPYVPFDFDGEDDFQPALDAYLDRAQSYGFDVLRVPFLWAAAEPNKGEWDEVYLTRYDALVDGAGERGIFVIVDVHQDLFAEGYCGDGFPAWTIPDAPDPQHECEQWFLGYLTDDRVSAAFDDFWSDASGNRTAFGEMWDVLAARYADRANVVAFEVLNEPSWGTASREEWSATVLTPFMSEMAARIHAVDPDALVLVEPSGLDGSQHETAMLRPEGDGLVFAPHFYDPLLFLSDGAPESDPLEALTDWDAVGDEWDLPVLMGEMGLPSERPGAGPFAAAHFDALDELQMHGTWWEYSDAAELWNYEAFSIVGPDGEEEEVLLDAIVRPYPRAIAGTDATWSWDGNLFSMSWSAVAGGVTEVATPSSLWADGAEVRGRGLCIAEAGDRVLVQTKDAGPIELEIAAADP